MAEETNNALGAMTAEEYISNLEEIKKNMVDKSEYDRVAAENRTLAEAITNGCGKYEEPERPKADINKLRESLFSNSKKRSNLEYFTDVIALRNAIKEESGEDIFLPHNHEYIPNRKDQEDAERIASVIGECIEYADGNPQIFTNELQRRCGVSRNK